MYLAALEKNWEVAPGVHERFSIVEELFCGSTLRWFSARERSSGVMRFVQSDGAESGSARLAMVAEKLSGVKMPHLLELLEAHPDFIVYPWQGEHPLAAQRGDGIVLSEKLRICHRLVETLEGLQALSRPLAHGAISASTVWVTPTLHWPRLAAFDALESGRAAMEADTLGIIELAKELSHGGFGQQELLAAMEEVSSDFMAGKRADWRPVKAQLSKMYISLVSQDL